MSIAAPPPPVPGLTWRPASIDDADALTGLFDAVNAVEDLDFVPGPAGVRYYLALPGVDLEQDSLIAATSDGSAAAFAWVWVTLAGEAWRAFLRIETHPEHTGLEAALLTWAEERARARLGDACGIRRYLRLHVEEHRLRRHRVVAEAGFRHARTFVEMHRPLPLPASDPPPLPPEITIVPWSPAWDDATRLAANQAFALHWDSLPMSPAEWEQRVSADPMFRPDLSRLAIRDGQVLALCLAVVDPEHNDREGVAEVRLERVGTRPVWHRRGLATTLLLHSLHAGSAAGMTRAGLTVDEANTTRATGLYERLGFTTERRTFAYLKDVD